MNETRELYFHAGLAARMGGVHVQTLRNMRRQDRIQYIERENGWFLYSGSEINRLRRDKMLPELSPAQMSDCYVAWMNGERNSTFFLYPSG